MGLLLSKNTCLFELRGNRLLRNFLSQRRITPYRTTELYSIKTSFWPCLWHGEFASSLPLPSAQAKACWGRCPQTPIHLYPQSFHINTIFTYSYPFYL